MINSILSLSSVLSTIGSVFLSILILLLTITVHEFGHYIVGKILKFKINEFSIGMGPVLYKKVKKSGEVFSIRLLPLGGFCAFEGEDEDGAPTATQNEKGGAVECENGEKLADSAINADNSAETDEQINSNGTLSNGEDDFFNDEVKAVKKLSPNAFNNKKPWQRILVLIAGASLNFIFAILLVFLNFAIYGHSCFETYEIKSSHASVNAYEEFSLESGDRITSIDGKYVYLTTDFVDALNGKKKGDMVKIKVVDKSGASKTRDVMLRSDVNSRSMSDFLSCFKALGVATVPYVKPDSESKLADGAYLFRFNDKNAPDGESEEYYQCTRIYDVDSICVYLANCNEGDTVGFWMSSDDENAIGGKQLVNVTLTDWDSVDKTDKVAVMDYLGIEIDGENSSDNELLYSYQVSSGNVRMNFGELLYRPVVYSFKTVGQTFRAIGGLFNGTVAITEVSGPVGTVAFTSEYVKYGFNYVLEIASIIGISVAIFNLLPIPALDGARVVFVAIEWIFKKRVSRKIEGTIHAVGLIALLFFAVFIDLIKLFI